ncbi:LysE family translocator [Haloferax sp. DFSO52]|uniref:LysE family translocator n=1 Tax=Haloferax sp. DFSO52 TaxID=3388505 RepID=UPI003A8C7C8A
MQGIALGVSIAAPVGPIGILCIQRTLARGRRAGFVSGLGAASADAVYAAIAGFGLTALSSILLDHQTGIRLVGGLFLVYLGLQSFRAEPTTGGESTGTQTDRTTAEHQTLARDYASTFLLTLTNPVTILAFVGIFAGLGVGLSGTYVDAAVLVVGVTTGSALWWFLLSTGVSLFRTRFTRPVLRRVNQLAGVVIGGFGVFVLVGLL